jgi:uncharacterized protein (DUF1810 family)
MTNLVRRIDPPLVTSRKQLDDSVRRKREQLFLARPAAIRDLGAHTASPRTEAALMFDLDRFRSAQARGVDGFNAALAELQAGRKRSHWIWYIFPQLTGLGSSAMAVRYGLQGVAEAMEYLRDGTLRGRLLVLTNTLVTQLQGRPAPALRELMGSEIDALKLVSSMTLFRGVARRLSDVEPLPEYAQLAANADAILNIAAQQGFPECASTLRELASAQ